MRDPLGLNERLFARWYPLVCGLADRAGQRETRARLIADARGRTLEIGAGSGLNLAHYPDQVSELIISEPSPHMLEQLRTQLNADPPRVRSWELVQAGAEELPFEDRRFDTVVGTYVLCSVDDPDRVLREVERVLRPGGHYLYLEHVHAGEGTMLGRFQDLVEVPHRYIAAGCHPNRRTKHLLEASPLAVERLSHGRMPRSFPTVSRIIVGAARAATSAT
jgi:ubiquinone/menaquinone biosynthesis C-methylase UbiE